MSKAINAPIYISCVFYANNHIIIIIHIFMWWIFIIACLIKWNFDLKLWNLFLSDECVCFFYVCQFWSLCTVSKKSWKTFLQVNILSERVYQDKVCLKVSHVGFSFEESLYTKLKNTLRALPIAHCRRWFSRTSNATLIYFHLIASN